MLFPQNEVSGTPACHLKYIHYSILFILKLTWSLQSNLNFKRPDFVLNRIAVKQLCLPKEPVLFYNLHAFVPTRNSEEFTGGG